MVFGNDVDGKVPYRRLSRAARNADRQRIAALLHGIGGAAVKEDLFPVVQIDLLPRRIHEEGDTPGRGWRFPARR